MPTAESTRGTAGWFLEVEALKAVAIVGVIVAHAGRAPWTPGVSHFERWIAMATMFTVPCFLFCSGFLQCTGAPVPWQVVRRRLARLLVPYLVASLLAQSFRRHVLHQSTSPVSDLLLGSSFGAYYYVFIIVTLTLALPLLSRLPRRLLVLVVIGLVCTGALRSFGQWLPENQGRLALQVSDPGLRIVMRHPLLTWGYFLVGYLLRLEYARVLPWIGARRLPLILVTGAGSAGCLVALALFDTQPLLFLSYPLVYLSVALLVALWFGRPPRLRAVAAFLAGQTYPIYLYHLFFVFWAQRQWPQPAHGFSLLHFVGYVLFGLLGASLWTALVQRLAPLDVQRWLLGHGVSPGFRAHPPRA